MRQTIRGFKPFSKRTCRQLGATATCNLQSNAVLHAQVAYLEAHVLNVDLSHIDSRRLVTGCAGDVCNLVEIVGTLMMQWPDGAHLLLNASTAQLRKHS